MRGQYPWSPSRCVRPEAIIARRSLPGRALDPHRRRRHLDGHGDDLVPGVPGRHRGGATDLAEGSTRGAGHRGAQLRAVAHGLGGRRRRRARRARSAPPRTARSTRASPARARRASTAGTGRCATPEARCCSMATGPPTPSTRRPRTDAPTATTRCSAARRSPTCARSWSATTAPRRCRGGGSSCRSTTSRPCCALRARGPAERRSPRRASSGSAIRLGGGGEQHATLDASGLRDAVNTWASCLLPRRYPSGGLPVTIPSGWFSVSSNSRGLTIDGRGWGHGVGMVQWGAYGKAVRGWSAARASSPSTTGDSHLGPTRSPVRCRSSSRPASARLTVDPSRAGASIGDHVLGTRKLHIIGGDTVTVSTR